MKTLVDYLGEHQRNRLSEVVTREALEQFGISKGNTTRILNRMEVPRGEQPTHKHLVELFHLAVRNDRGNYASSPMGAQNITAVERYCIKKGIWVPQAHLAHLPIVDMETDSLAEKAEVKYLFTGSRLFYVIGLSPSQVGEEIDWRLRYGTLLDKEGSRVLENDWVITNAVLDYQPILQIATRKNFTA
ncbi:MAG TPA: hypothetical protein VJB87_04585 [Candidatus Nanoarchaeia archaeon]|nr:hypothetical protein [Candidatus Nanoarchaeia archaeon]